MSENASQKNEQLPFILILAAGLLAGVVTICLNILGNLRLNPAAVMLGALFSLCYIVIFIALFFFCKTTSPSVCIVASCGAGVGVGNCNGLCVCVWPGRE